MSQQRVIILLCESSETSESAQGHILYRKGPATQPPGRFHVSPDEPLFRRWLRERRERL